jgi:hypothetical protein
MLDSNSTADAQATADLHATADLKGERVRGDLYAIKLQAGEISHLHCYSSDIPLKKNGKIPVPTHSRIGRVEPLGTLEYSNRLL